MHDFFINTSRNLLRSSSSPLTSPLKQEEKKSLLYQIDGDYIKTLPSMPETIYFRDEYTFINDYEAKNVLSKTSLSFFDNSKADTVKCDKHISLNDQASVKKVKVGGGVFLNGNSHVDSIESTKIIYDSDTLVSITLKNESSAKTITAKDGVLLKGNSYADCIQSQKNVYLNGNASSKSIASKNCILNQSSHCDHISANIVIMEDNSFADEIITTKALIINNSASAYNVTSPMVRFNDSTSTARCINSDNNLSIKGNGSVENINVKGSQVIIEGQIQLKNKIRFENSSGKVILLRDKNGNFPDIRGSNVDNGEIIHTYNRKSHK